MAKWRDKFFDNGYGQFVKGCPPWQNHWPLACLYRGFSAFSHWHYRKCMHDSN